jgi:uncharacterized phage protein (TIGR02220 family)
MNEPLIPGGFILLSRRLIESEIWEKPPLYLKVWLYLLTKAQHKQYKGLKRGQLYTSIPEIIEACSWKVGFRVVRPTKDQIYQVIDWLRNPNGKISGSNDEADTKATMITTMKATHGLLINIDKYSVYQDPNSYESNAESNNERDTKATMNTHNTNKNVKNDKNEKEIIPYSEIILYLNKKTGKNFSSKSDANKKLISGRFSEGRTLEDFKSVIDLKCKQWLDNPDMNKYLRPATLFSQKNFENYVNEKQPVQQAKQPTSIRDKEIEFQQWVTSGGDPDAFNWTQ